MAPSKRIPYDDPRWTERKAAIRQMIANKEGQKQIRQKLEEDGFSVTKAQMEAQIKHWAFQTRMPKNESSAIWQYTDHYLSRREKQGKRSVVYHNGKEISSATIKKERSRRQASALVRYAPDWRPKTPENVLVSICTPTAMPLRLLWPPTLPWLLFQDNTQNRGSMHSLELSVPFLTWIPGSNCAKNVSGFAACLASMMPGSDENEIGSRAQLIMQGTITQAFNERVKVFLYGLSNNLAFSSHPNFSDKQEAWSWVSIIHLIEQSGMADQPIDLASMKDFTIASVAETLFKCCIDFRFQAVFQDKNDNDNDDENDCMDHSINESNMKIITWLLASKQDPNTRLDFYDGEISSALQYAARYHDFQLATQLLNAGADPTMGGRMYSPLLELLQDKLGQFSKATEQTQKAFLGLLQRLLKAGDSLHEAEDWTPSALMLAVKLDSQAADILIENGANIHHQKSNRLCPYHEDYIFCSTQSVLGSAVCTKAEESAMENIQRLLNQAKQVDPQTCGGDLITTDLLCNAASRGFDNVLAFCWGIGLSAFCTEDKLFAALCAASFFGRRKTCELLLEYGAPVNGPDGLDDIPCPIHFAALADKRSVVELLCEHEANVNSGFTHGKENHNKHREWRKAVANRALPSLNFVNSLGAAIFGAEKGKTPSSFQVLMRHGARLPDWAVHYGVSGRTKSWLVDIAAERGSDLNWRGPDGNTPVQVILKALSLPIEPYYYRVSSSTKVELIELLELLVNAGAITAGSEPEIAVVLERWDLLIEDHGPTDFKLTSHRRTLPITRLAAVLLGGSFSTIQETLLRKPDAYDPGALCASVMFAISSGTTSPLQQLLGNYKLDVNYSHLEGLTLGLAAWHERPDILDLLLAKVQWSAPAMLPIAPTRSVQWTTGGLNRERSKIESLLSELFEKKTIPFWHRQSTFGVHLERGSPLVLALWSGSCFEKLIEHGCYPDRLTMSVAVEYGDIKLLERLLRLPRRDNSHADRPGPMYLAVVKGRMDMLRIMLDNDEDPNETHHLVPSGRSPLQQAVENGELEMIELLLNAGAEVNAPAAEIRGATALQLASIKGRIGIVKRLVDLGADINAPGAKMGGRTALEGAAEHGRLDVVHFLLHLGAIVTGDGRLQYLKAIRFAEIENHGVVAKSLKNYREWSDLDDEVWTRLGWLDMDELEDMASLDQLMGKDFGDSQSPSESDGHGEASTEDSSLEEFRDELGDENDDMMLKEQRMPNDYIETTLSRAFESTNRGSEATQENMLSAPANTEHSEERVICGTGSEVSWSQQMQLASTSQSRDLVSSQTGTSRCHDIFEGDMEWVQAQDYGSNSFDMDWFRAHDDGSHMFDMDWS